MRHKTSSTDLTGILPEDLVKDVNQAAEISMGTEINDSDELHIRSLAD
jgi:nucleolar protein 58